LSGSGGGESEGVLDATVNASSSIEPFASSSTSAQVVESAGIWGIAENPIWRPKKFIRNDKYPGVSAKGFYFQDHSGGFALIHRKTNTYEGFYTKDAIQELEKQYGKANSKKRPKSR
jgi:hypothetical protein